MWFGFMQVDIGDQTQNLIIIKILDYFLDNFRSSDVANSCIVIHLKLTLTDEGHEHYIGQVPRGEAPRS